MTIYLDDHPPADGIPHRRSRTAAACLHQHRPRRTRHGYVAGLIQRDADPSDVIDQAIIMPLPDDRDVDTDLF